MAQSSTFGPDNPFRLALLVLLSDPNDDEALAPLRVDPCIEIVSVPYMETPDARTDRARNGGKLSPDFGGELPKLSNTDLETLAGCHGVMMLDKPDGLPELAPNLVWAQSIGAGYDHIDVAELETLPLVYCNASGVASVPIAEFVMARLLEVWKNLRMIEAQQVERHWEERFGRTVSGMNLGVVGLGAIGREVARRGRAFGMHVLASRGSASPGDTDPDVDELFPSADLDTFLPRCDAVVVAAPAIPATLDMFDARRLALMKEGSILCNVARGTLVVESDLVDSLTSGHLGAAVLDVTRDEPLPKDHPLWDAPNCYISPHSAPALDRYQQTLFELAAHNLGCLLAGEPLRNTIFDNRA